MNQAARQTDRQLTTALELQHLSHAAYTTGREMGLEAQPKVRGAIDTARRAKRPLAVYRLLPDCRMEASAEERLDHFQSWLGMVHSLTATLELESLVYVEGHYDTDHTNPDTPETVLCRGTILIQLCVGNDEDILRLRQVRDAAYADGWRLAIEAMPKLHSGIAAAKAHKWQTIPYTELPDCHLQPGDATVEDQMAHFVRWTGLVEGLRQQFGPRGMHVAGDYKPHHFADHAKSLPVARGTVTLQLF